MSARQGAGVSVQTAVARGAHGHLSGQKMCCHLDPEMPPPPVGEQGLLRGAGRRAPRGPRDPDASQKACGRWAVGSEDCAVRKVGTLSVHMLELTQSQEQCDSTKLHPFAEQTSRPTARQVL